MATLLVSMPFPNASSTSLAFLWLSATSVSASSFAATTSAWRRRKPKSSSCNSFREASAARYRKPCSSSRAAEERRKPSSSPSTVCTLASRCRISEVARSMALWSPTFSTAPLLRCSARSFSSSSRAALVESCCARQSPTSRCKSSHSVVMPSTSSSNAVSSRSAPAASSSNERTAREEKPQQAWCILRVFSMRCEAAISVSRSSVPLLSVKIDLCSYNCLTRCVLPLSAQERESSHIRAFLRNSATSCSCARIADRTLSTSASNNLAPVCASSNSACCSVCLLANSPNRRSSLWRAAACSERSSANTFSKACNCMVIWLTSLADRACAPSTVTERSLNAHPHDKASFLLKLSSVCNSSSNFFT
mmetsp:Transcript_173127/g.555119  ORF Transcript_173127/g.555119 Transcript_173127/m.555119 type:complete len:364 (-) Transcript_173127:892-1983(-)